MRSPGVRSLTLTSAGAVASLVLLGSHLAPHHPEEPVGLPWAGPGSDALLGTDGLGRDVLSRVLHGGTGLLAVSVLAAVVSVVCGTALGLAAGWGGGRLARAVFWLCDLLLSVPALVLALVLAVTVPGGTAVVVASVLSGTPLTARVVAGEAVLLRSRGHVRAALERGETVTSVLAREVLPELRGLVTADAGLRLVTALQIASALAVLGLGPQPPDADWALMLSENLPGAALNPAALLAPAVLLAGCAWALAAAAHRVGQGKEHVV